MKERELNPPSESALPEDIAALLPPDAREGVKAVLADEKITTFLRAVDDSEFWQERTLAQHLKKERDLSAVLAVGFLGELLTIEERSKESLREAPQQERVAGHEESGAIARDIAGFRTEIETKSYALNILNPRSEDYRNAIHEIFNQTIALLARIQKLKKLLRQDPTISAKSVLSKGFALRASYFLSRGEHPLAHWFIREEEKQKFKTPPENRYGSEWSPANEPWNHEPSLKYNDPEMREVEYFAPEEKFGPEEMKRIKALVARQIAQWATKQENFSLMSHGEYLRQGAMFSVMAKFYSSSWHGILPVQNTIQRFLREQRDRLYDELHNIENAKKGPDAERKRQRNITFDIAALSHRLVALTSKNKLGSGTVAILNHVAEDFVWQFNASREDLEGIQATSSEDEYPAQSATEGLVFLKIWNPQKFEQLARDNPFVHVIIEGLRSKLEDALEREEMEGAAYFLAMLTAHEIKIDDNTIVTKGKWG